MLLTLSWQCNVAVCISLTHNGYSSKEVVREMLPKARGGSSSQFQIRTICEIPINFPFERKGGKIIDVGGCKCVVWRGINQSKKRAGSEVGPRLALHNYPTRAELS